METAVGIEPARDLGAGGSFTALLGDSGVSKGVLERSQK